MIFNFAKDRLKTLKTPTELTALYQVWLQEMFFEEYKWLTVSSGDEPEMLEMMSRQEILELIKDFEDKQKQANEYKMKYMKYVLKMGENLDLPRRTYSNYIHNLKQRLKCL